MVDVVLKIALSFMTNDKFGCNDLGAECTRGCDAKPAVLIYLVSPEKREGVSSLWTQRVASLWEVACWGSLWIVLCVTVCSITSSLWPEEIG